MHTKRIIPCLDVNNGRVVKGVNFVDLKDAGDPVEIGKAYDKAGADELVFLDITATSDARGTVVDMVRKVAETVFIPFTVGGGIRTVEDFKMLPGKAQIRSLSILRPLIPQGLSRTRQTSSAASAWWWRSMPRKDPMTADGTSIKMGDVSMWALTRWNGQGRSRAWEPERFFLPVWTVTGLRLDTIWN